MFDFLGPTRSFVEKETQTYLVFGTQCVYDFFHRCTLNKFSQKVGFIRKAFDTKISRHDPK